MTEGVTDENIGSSKLGDLTDEWDFVVNPVNVNKDANLNIVLLIINNMTPLCRLLVDIPCNYSYSFTARQVVIVCDIVVMDIVETDGVLTTCSCQNNHYFPTILLSKNNHRTQ